jgi:hypothetical protein
VNDTGRRALSFDITILVTVPSSVTIFSAVSFGRFGLVAGVVVPGVVVPVVASAANTAVNEAHRDAEISNVRTKRCIDILLGNSYQLIRMYRQKVAALKIVP